MPDLQPGNARNRVAAGIAVKLVAEASETLKPQREVVTRLRYLAADEHLTSEAPDHLDSMSSDPYPRAFDETEMWFASCLFLNRERNRPPGRRPGNTVGNTARECGLTRCFDL